MATLDTFTVLDNDRLAELARKAAEIAGFDGEVEAEYKITPTKLSVSWQRTYRWISFSVSHWLADAPEDVITGVLVIVFDKIHGCEFTGNTEEIQKWVSENRHKWSKEGTAA